MPLSTADAAAVLNGLIETCKDAHDGLELAAKDVSNPQLKEALLELARQRDRFRAELAAEVQGLGGDPETTGTVGGALQRGWLHLKAALAKDDAHAVLAECERAEEATLKSYGQALEKDLPSEVRATVTRQQIEIQQSHQRLRALRDVTR